MTNMRPRKTFFGLILFFNFYFFIEKNMEEIFFIQRYRDGNPAKKSYCKVGTISISITDFNNATYDEIRIYDGEYNLLGFVSKNILKGFGRKVLKTFLEENIDKYILMEKQIKAHGLDVHYILSFIEQFIIDPVSVDGFVSMRKEIDNQSVSIDGSFRKEYSDSVSLPTRDFIFMFLKAISNFMEFCEPNNSKFRLKINSLATTMSYCAGACFEYSRLYESKEREFKRQGEIFLSFLKSSEYLLWV